jgi:hypothetical protein
MGISVVYNSAIAMYYLQTHDQINAMKTIKNKRKIKRKKLEAILLLVYNKINKPINLNNT